MMETIPFQGLPGVEYFGLISSCLIVSYVALLCRSGRQGLKKNFSLFGKVLWH